MTEKKDDSRERFKEEFDNDGFVLDRAAEPIETIKIIHFIEAELQATRKATLEEVEWAIQSHQSMRLPTNETEMHAILQTLKEKND